MKKTKIVCTLGPSTDSEQVLRQMIQEGMNVARFNFSHGVHSQHVERTNLVKKLREELDTPVSLLLDTKGPEMRLGFFDGGKAVLKKGEQFILTTEEVVGTDKRATVDYKGFISDLGDRDLIMLADGAIQLKVERVDKNEVVCRILNEGVISDKKHVNVPGMNLSIPYVSEQDKKDLLFAIEYGFDYVAASFVRTAADVLDVKRILEENGGRDIRIIAKIENSQGVENVDEIVKVADGLMIARGDLGVEIAFEELPNIQKSFIKLCNEKGKYVITATQMLESMISNPTPTRAEISDVANAIYDGTSAIMLSGETAVGQYPVEAVKTMTKIAVRTEADINYKKRFNDLDISYTNNISNAISYATVSTAHSLDAAAILTITTSGSTASMVSKFRPQSMILGCTPNKRVYNQLALAWGVCPLITPNKVTTDELFKNALSIAMDKGYVKNGEIVVMTAGVPVGVTGTTNTLKVIVAGDVLASGKGVSDRSVSGALCVCKNEEEALKKFKEGDILVIPYTTNRLLPALKKAKGIITEQEGVSSHAAVVGLTLDIPVVTGVAHATELLKNGAIVTIDGSKGLIYNGIARAL